MISIHAPRGERYCPCDYIAVFQSTLPVTTHIESHSFFFNFNRSRGSDFIFWLLVINLFQSLPVGATHNKSKSKIKEFQSRSPVGATKPSCLSIRLSISIHVRRRPYRFHKQLSPYLISIHAPVASRM